MNMERTPPCDLDAEMGLIGSLLVLPDCIDDVLPIVVAADFYDPPLSILFKHLVLISEEGKRGDTVLLAERLRSAGEYEAAGGGAMLARCAQAVPTATNAEYYARIVADKSMKRACISAGNRILLTAYDDSSEGETVLSIAEEELFQIGENRISQHEPVSIFDTLQGVMAEISARKENVPVPGSVQSGMVDVDKLLGGFMKASMIVIAGRPSMGKTAFALNIVENSSMDADKRSLFITLEMSSSQISERLLLSRAGIDSRRAMKGILSSGERERIVEVAGELSGAPIHIDDSYSHTIASIGSEARRYKRRHGLDLLILDYMQLITPNEEERRSKANRQEKVAAISKSIKGLAKQLDIPIIVLAQLNRMTDRSSGARPTLSNLRESGAIEQDADVVILLHRPEYYDAKEENRGLAYAIVAKNRNGPTGDVQLQWEGSLTRFQDCASASQSNEFDYKPTYFGDRYA